MKVQHPGRPPCADVYEAGLADPAIIASTIEQAATQSGFRVTPTSDPQVGIVIAGRQRAPWYVILLCALPQRLEWRVQSSDRGTMVFADRRAERWYRAVLAGACGAAAALLWSAMYLIASPSIDRSPPALFALGCAVALLWLCARWCACGSLIVERLWVDVHSKLAEHGIYLDHRPDAGISRWVRAQRRFLGFVIGAALVAVLIALLAPGAHIRMSPGLILVMVASVLLGAILVVLLVVGSRKPGLESRMRLGMPGLAGLLFLFLTLASQMPALLNAKLDDSSWELMFAFRGIVLSAPLNADPIRFPTGKTVTREDIRQAMLTVKLLMGATILAVPLLWCVAVLCVVPSLRSIGLLMPHGRRLSEAAEVATIRRAISGQGYLRHFRTTTIGVWAVAALLVWGCLFALVKTGVYAIFFEPMGWTSGGRDVAGVTALAAMIAFDCPEDSTGPEFVSRALWSWWATMLVLLLTASVLEWLRRRYRSRRMLRQLSVAASATEQGRTLMAMITDVANAGGIKPPRACVLEDPTPNASAQEFGILGRDRFLAVTTGCLRALQGPELSALLAHECAHLARGHCRKHNLLQILGRVTFVGDAFVGTLEHSFGYELDADRAAVEQFRASPDALKRALIKLRAVATLHRLHRASMPGGLLAQPRPADSPGSRAIRSNLFRRVFEILHLWVRLYTGDSQFAYWHPAVSDRVDALRAQDRPPP